MADRIKSPNLFALLVGGTPLILATLFCFFSLAYGSFTVVLVLIFIASTVRIIPERNVWIVEFLGKYWCTWTAGVSIVVPLLMKARSKIFTGDQLLALKLDGKTEGLDGKVRSLVDVINDSVKVDAEITIRVIPEMAYTATYEIQSPSGDYKDAVLSAVESGIRAEFGGNILAIVLQKGMQYGDTIREKYTDVFKRWGIDFRRLFIKDIGLLDATINLRRQRLDAETDKDAKILRAEGKKQALTLIGEGEGNRLARASEIAKLDPEKIAAINLTDKQAEVLKGATIILKSGEDVLSIPGATAEAVTVFDTIRKPKKET